MAILLDKCFPLLCTTLGTIVFANGDTSPIASLGLELRLSRRLQNARQVSSANRWTRESAELRHIATNEHRPSNNHVVQTSRRLMRQWRCHAFTMPSLSIMNVLDLSMLECKIVVLK